MIRKLLLAGAMVAVTVGAAEAQTVKLNPNLLYQSGTSPTTLPTLSQVQTALATANAALPTVSAGPLATQVGASPSAAVIAALGYTPPQVGTSGSTVGLLNSAKTDSGADTYSGNLILTGSGTTFGSPTAAWSGRIEGTSTQQKGLFWAVGGGSANTRFFAGADGAAATNTSPGDNFIMQAYTNAGVSAGQFLKAIRGSGPDFSGPAYMNIAPFNVLGNYAGQDSGTDGIDEDYGTILEPTYTLGMTPISITSGSPTVNITWNECCDASNTNSPFTGGGDEWVDFATPVTVGNITLSGWYQTAIVSNSVFSIQAGTNATSTVTGGTAAQFRPSFVTTNHYEYSVFKTGAGGGFPVQNEDIYYANPEFNDPNNSSNYEQLFTRFVTPNDVNGTGNWGAAEWEDDLYNRCNCASFNPILHNTTHPTNGILIGPHRTTNDANGGGGQGYNWDNLIAVFGSDDSIGRLGSYDAINIGADSIASVYDDPNGHGGVVMSAIGSYNTLTSNPFFVGASTSQVTVTFSGQGRNGGILVGDNFWLEGLFTVNGLTFGNAEYTVTGFNFAAGTLTFNATGTSGGTPASGGGSGSWLSFAKGVPDSIINGYGEWAHGLIHTEINFKSDDGLLVHTSPGNGFGWDDGTAIASINGNEISAGNVGITLTTAGTGNLTMNGTAAVTCTAGTPSSSFTVKNGIVTHC